VSWGDRICFSSAGERAAGFGGHSNDHPHPPTVTIQTARSEKNRHADRKIETNP
jgi:hypothetical protein